LTRNFHLGLPGWTEYTPNFQCIAACAEIFLRRDLIANVFGIR